MGQWDSACTSGRSHGRKTDRATRSIPSFPVLRLPSIVLLVLALISAGCSRPGETPIGGAADQYWPRFRGAGGLGVCAGGGAPVSWDAHSGAGIRWRTPLPLPGNSSPVLWGDRLFVTGATQQRRQVYCLDARSGRLRWSRAVRGVPGSPTPPPLISSSLTGYAAPTPVTDGRRVCALFTNGDLACFSLDGALLWQRSLGLADNFYSHASSPVIAGELVVVQYDQALEGDGKSRLYAFSLSTGKPAWEQPRPVAASWSTPITVTVGKREELITCAAPWIIAYAPASGKELWRARCLRDDVAPSPGFTDGVVYAANIRSQLSAARAGGNGDVTRSRVLWTSEKNLPSIPSVLAAQRFVLLVDTEGMITCFDRRNGKVLWEQALNAEVFSSPVLCGDNVYVTETGGTTHVFPLATSYREIGLGRLYERVNATPAFVPGALYLRTDAAAYCLASPGQSARGAGR